MTTEYTKPVAREMKIKDSFGHEGDVIVTINNWGIEFRKKGTSRKLSVTWDKIAKASSIPPNAPSKYFGNQMGWLVEPT